MQEYEVEDKLTAAEWALVGTFFTGVITLISLFVYGLYQLGAGIASVVGSLL